jgi:hypothetical protein
MILKSFGCSFIFGTDLSDDVSDQMFDWSDNGKWIRPSQLTWPALIANDINYNYTSYALPGIGNLQILESILKEISSSDKDDLFVIQWTWIDRFDYENLNRNNRENFWNTILPTGADKNSDWYYKNIHSEYRDKLNSLIYIKTAIDALKENNIPFLITNIDDLVFDQRWHFNSAIDFLQKYTKPYVTYFEGLNFLNWAQEKNFPISKKLHPLEQAHKEAVKVLYRQNAINHLHLS